MKVLFIGKCSPDYQSDCLIHGLYNLLGADFTHNRSYDLMYKGKISDEELKSSSGMGFTIWNNLPEYLNDNSDLENKIKNHYFSLIIYGNPYFVTSLGGSCMDYFDLVCKHYKQNEVFFIDGEDTQQTFDTFGFPLFKRELTFSRDKIFPISFAIPLEKIVKEKPIKLNNLSDYRPGTRNNYRYNSEEEYYQNYRDAYFGITHKKSGWDCMRHYEILANYCLPLFEDLGYCPQMTMVNFPKKLIMETNTLFYKKDSKNQIDESLDKVYKYTEEKLTTLKLAEYILEMYSKMK